MKYEDEIIQYLFQQTDYVKSDDIAFALNISKRSLLYRLKQIKQEHPDLILSSREGLKLNHAAYNFTNTYKKIPTNYYERKVYIVKKILINNQKLTLFELAEKLAISENSLQNDLSKFRNELKTFNLSITTHDYVQICGTDYDKRKLIMLYINEESKISFYSLEKLQSIFTLANLQNIKKVVIDILNKHDYFIDNYSLTNYVLHLALVIEMMNNQPVSTTQIKESEIIDKIISFGGGAHVYNIVKEIYDNLLFKYNYTYNIENIYDISVLFMSRIISRKIKNNLNAIPENILSTDVNTILNDIIHSIHDDYGIDLVDNDFLLRFGMHINGLLYRAKNNIKINSLQFESIKNNYPLIYAISINIINRIQNLIKLSICEAEISYIALHIGSALDKQQSNQNKVNCLLICTDYNDIGLKLIEKINTIYAEKINIADVITDLDSIDKSNNYDLVLSTRPLPQKYGKKQLQIDYFLNSSSINNINTSIDLILKNRLLNQFKSKLQYFFHSDVFFISDEFDQRDQTIDFLCENLLSNNYVYKEYRDEIYQHEEISSSAYGKIAIPHPLSNNSKTSVIAVLISKNPISWGINNVNIVFMLSINNNDKMFFRDIFNVITDFISNTTNFNQLLQIKSIDDFIDLISNSAD
ncbi:MAG: PTS sugar transporter subunit IIA [Erysipelotrichia bacterium]|nr:PTS sugar transporter subunit IIA [Erysipelotrichia bacterium]